MTYFHLQSNQLSGIKQTPMKSLNFSIISILEKFSESLHSSLSIRAFWCWFEDSKAPLNMLKANVKREKNVNNVDWCARLTGISK